MAMTLTLHYPTRRKSYRMNRLEKTGLGIFARVCYAAVWLADIAVSSARLAVYGLGAALWSVVLAAAIYPPAGGILDWLIWYGQYYVRALIG